MDEKVEKDPNYLHIYHEYFLLLLYSGKSGYRWNRTKYTGAIQTGDSVRAGLERRAVSIKD